MRKIIITITFAVLSSAMTTANAGLADRINEARSYPNKTVKTPTKEPTCIKGKDTHEVLSDSETCYQKKYGKNLRVMHITERIFY